MLPSINLAQDSLGLGAISGGIGAARASSVVAGCGNRPLFGKEAKRAFEACVARQQALNGQAMTLSAQNSQAQAGSGSQTLWIVLAVVAVIVVLILILRR